jgi:hypothetical protein
MAEVVLDIGDDHHRVVPDELGGGHLAYAARAFGDDGDLPGQPANQFINGL